MTYSRLREQTDQRVVTLGNFMGLKNSAIDQGRAEARAIVANQGDIDDIWVSLAWRLKFPRRSTYGEAFNALLSVVNASWKITNNLKAATARIQETDTIIRPPQSGEGMFNFFQVVKHEKLSASIEETCTTITEPAMPATMWDYLCFATTEPDLFHKKLYVAVGDRVPSLLLDDCTHAPSFSLENGRVRLAALPKKARPNGIAFHHMVTQALRV